MFLLISVGCWSAENTNTTNTTSTATVINTANTTNETGTTDLAANTANTANTENPADSPSAANLPITGSPMETLKTLHNASLAKNPPAIKKMLSKSSIAMIEESARNQKKTVDQLLKEDDGAPFKFKELPEMRNEKINGSLATVEVKPKGAEEWESIPFIAENGEWKVMLDLIYRNLEQQYLEELRKNQSK